MTTIAKVLLAGPDMKMVFRALRYAKGKAQSAPAHNKRTDSGINWPENRLIRPLGRQPHDPHGMYGAGNWEDPFLLELRRKG